MPDLESLAKMDVKIHIIDMKGHYNIILGWYILTKLGIILDFEQRTVQWGNKTVKMRPTDFIQEMYYFVHNIPDISAEMDRILKILDAKYQLSNLEEVTAKNENLMSIQRT